MLFFATAISRFCYIKECWKSKGTIVGSCHAVERLRLTNTTPYDAIHNRHHSVTYTHIISRWKNIVKCFYNILEHDRGWATSRYPLKPAGFVGDANSITAICFTRVGLPRKEAPKKITQADRLNHGSPCMLVATRGKAKARR